MLPSPQEGLQTLKALIVKANTLANAGLVNEAIRYWEQILDINKRELGPEHRDAATSLVNLAELYERVGRYEQAEELYRRSPQIREKILGSQNTETAQSLNGLATRLYGRGNDREAEALLRRTLTIRQMRWGRRIPIPKTPTEV
ncbi:MAG: tetratricopeptide repeat protein [Cyanobium sp.]